MWLAHTQIRAIAVSTAIGLLAVFSNSDARAADHLVLGTVPIAATQAPVVVGQDAGFFKDAGIDLEIANAVQFPNVIGDIMAGTYQVGTVNVGSISNAIIQGLPIKIIANNSYSDGEQKLMVLSNGSIKTIADLKGKHIGLGGLNNNFQAGIITQMKEAGVDLSTVTFTLISPPDLPAALRNHVVDAAQINEPGIAAAGDEFTAVIPEPFKPFGDKPCNVYMIARADWADQNKELVERFVTAYNKGADLAESDKEAVVKAVMSFTDIPKDTLEKMTMPGFGSDLHKDSFVATVKTMNELGFLKRNVTVEEAFWKP
jgi:ABC-type nitrate/sulfonate/bicarbonate transport system substrate-binding protein